MSNINLVSPTGFTSAVLIGDSSDTGSSPSMTTSGGNTVSAALEIQSTNGSLLIPRMTTAEKTALTTVVNGMMVYDSTLNLFSFYQDGAWLNGAGTGGVIAATGTITTAEFTAAYTTAHEILAAQGANTLIKVHGFALELVYGGTAFTNGGSVSIQYRNTANAGGTLVVTPIAATNFTGATASNYYNFAIPAVTATTANTVNQGIYLSSEAPAFATGNSTFNWYLWYSVITTT